MRIDSVTITPVLLPFTAEFAHSLRKRNQVANLIVEISAENGRIRGYGEGAPRSYVTGETQAEAVAFLARAVRQPNFPWRLDDTSVLWAFSASLLEPHRWPSAVCALETALLDAWGRYCNLAMAEFFPADFATEKIRYGAAVPLTDPERTRRICRFIQVGLKINRVKLKWGADLAQNRRAVEALVKVFGPQVDLKIDVNCVWDLPLALAHEDLIRTYPIRAIEQPMPPDDPAIGTFADLLRRLDVALMADESACSLSDVKRLHRQGHYNMINVRLSKCGGLQHAQRIIAYLRQHRIVFQIACHLGESGVLSAAGRTLSLLCRDAVYHDGSYDKYLLKQNITRQDVTFGRGGVAGPLSGPGLGVIVDMQQLARLTGNGAPLTVARP